MRALDPRLLRRTKSARPLLALDTILGIVTALAVPILVILAIVAIVWAIRVL